MIVCFDWASSREEAMGQKDCPTIGAVSSGGPEEHSFADETGCRAGVRSVEPRPQILIAETELDDAAADQDLLVLCLSTNPGRGCTPSQWRWTRSCPASCEGPLSLVSRAAQTGQGISQTAQGGNNGDEPA